MTTMTDERAMTWAREIANGECTLAWHDGDRGHRAIRLTGCRPEEARRIGMAIQRALLGPSDPETGLLLNPKQGFTEQSGWAGVWVR
jgi:hypothetical protein